MEQNTARTAQRSGKRRPGPSSNDISKGKSTPTVDPALERPFGQFQTQRTIISVYSGVTRILWNLGKSTGFGTGNIAAFANMERPNGVWVAESLKITSMLVGQEREPPHVAQANSGADGSQEERDAPGPFGTNLRASLDGCSLHHLICLLRHLPGLRLV